MTRHRTKLIIGFLILSLSLPACRRGTPDATQSPVSTVAPTNTSAPTMAPFAPGAASVTFHPYENNPLLTPGKADTWDSGVVFGPRVIFHQGAYHLFYNGSTDLSVGSIAIGYATSPDGLTFTRHPSNPVFTDDDKGFDAVQVSDGVPLVIDGTWVLYYNASGRAGPGPTIGRATAPSPTGPWKRLREPVLRSGETGAWDAGFVIPQSVIPVEGGYVMYYAGGTDQPGEPAMIGRATSPDGVNWEKHGEPVLRPGASGDWDDESLWGCSVLKTRDGWEMFYSGSHSGAVQIGYATSDDGIHWTRYDGNPIFTLEEDPVATKSEPYVLESPFVVFNGSTYLLYYDYGFPKGGIGAATAKTIP